MDVDDANTVNDNELNWIELGPPPTKKRRLNKNN